MQDQSTSKQTRGSKRSDETLCGSCCSSFPEMMADADADTLRASRERKGTRYPVLQTKKAGDLPRGSLRALVVSRSMRRQDERNKNFVRMRTTVQSARRHSLLPGA